MTFEYAILPDQRLVLVRLEGPFYLHELTASAGMVCSDQRYDAEYDGLIDLTSMVVTISTRDIKDLISFTLSKEKYSRGKWAVLVNTPIATALAMLYQKGVTQRHHLSLFCTLEGAEKFLERTIEHRFFKRPVPKVSPLHWGSAPEAVPA